MGTFPQHRNKTLKCAHFTFTTKPNIMLTNIFFVTEVLPTTHLNFYSHLYISTQQNPTHTHGTHKYIQHIQLKPFVKANITYTQIVPSNKTSCLNRGLSVQTQIPNILHKNIINHFENHTCTGINHAIKLLNPIFNMATHFCEILNENKCISMRIFLEQHPCKITKYYLFPSNNNGENYL